MLEETLLSGLLGAIIGATIVAIYEEYRFRRNIKLNIAREKLEKIYSPLYFLIEKSKVMLNKEEDKILYSSKEGELIDNIILKYYHLVDEDLRRDILLLYPPLRNKKLMMIH